MDDSSDKFYYIYSSQLDVNVRVKIGTLDGHKERQQFDKLLEDPMLKFCGLYQQETADLKVVCQVFADNRPLALPVCTSYKPFTTRWNWNEWVTLPVLFSDLPRNAQLALTIYDCIGCSQTQPVGGTTISLFGKHGVFRTGMIDLKVWPNCEADGNFPSQTPGKTKDNGKIQTQRLAKLVKKHKIGQLPVVDWLDRLAFLEIEVINEMEKKNSNFFHLMIEFPFIEVNSVPHSIVYYEHDGDEIYMFKPQADIVTIPDHEVLQENLVESKHHKLARSIRSGVSDRDLKPNAIVRDALNTIVGYPPTTQLSVEEQDLVWKFRFYLSNQKKALTKFLKCVNWSIASENRQAIELLNHWAPMDVEDALELLSPNFTHPVVRKYAVTRLKQACDEDLLLYLLQLVQALKYENFECIKAASLVSKNDDNSLVSRNEKVSSENHLVINTVNDNIQGNNTELNEFSYSNDGEEQNKTDFGEENCDLASFLIDRASKNTTLANYFYWYLVIECEEQENNGKQDSKVREMYMTVMKLFSEKLMKGNGELKKRRQYLQRQQNFINKLVQLVKTVARESGNRKKKTERLQYLLSDPEALKFNFTNFEPLLFPLDPQVLIKGIIPEKASLFKSALMPSRLTFLTDDNKEYVAIFKYGDDLRQDQLILQMITLMDKLLRSENLDLKLTPYRVLATSAKHGFLQFIESTTVAEVLESEGSIHNYFRKHHPNSTGPYGISSEVVDSYVRSCAGYCVITYLLGVGDRHFDNLLLTKDGKLFHIDFGYILGRDPKPMPPPMKLSKEMVDAMGGENSEHYQQFRKQCYTAFLHLRRHANLMLNLFSLMVDASVPDIALEPDKAVKKVQDKFRLDLTDEEAVHYMQNLLDLSVSAVMPALVEHFHKLAQYWRK
ncbi:Phosphatidylinositol 3-kinase catalytic subunit type, putative [Pediculus humanus corporis]|uniref:Phosphatidylinositol 3-kinase catalytic subunit type 3 n=1 Tax=Pediculus humanus subsp. corporis TaxID=121224 RepID=E0VQ65_PEDHC|nr:Phosphatidylinositol 3-kinase catalytic subunit type, putative [Pediculus humanus corporis]EEB15521.1 Phosphatidylinositol 3-kinase catalytic subunit type, putative [Pediculus humanus corporis]